MDPARDFNAAGAKPTPHFPPIVENRAARRTQSRLRVVLLNAAGGKRFGEIARCLKRPPLRDADVILLCEVNSKPRGPAVAMELARLLEMSCAYIPEYGLKPPDGEIVLYMGNAILSSVPFEDVTAVAMHRPRTPMAWPMRMRRWKRVGTPTGLVTNLKFGGEEITVGVAHLHSRCTPAERARQMATYLESFPASGRAIFGECGAFVVRGVVSKLLGDRRIVVCDGGISHNFLQCRTESPLARRQVPVLCSEHAGAPSPTPLTLVGASCSPSDVLCELPAGSPEPRAGDRYVFMEAGAYHPTYTPSNFLSAKASRHYVL